MAKNRKPAYARNKMKPTSGINNASIVDKLELLQKLEKDTACYFRCDSAFWDAICQHVVKSPIGTIIQKQNPNLKGIQQVIYRKAYARPAGAYPNANTTVRIIFDIIYYDDDSEVSDNNIILDVPIDLIEKFTQEKFDKWLNARKTELRERIDKDIIKRITPFIEQNIKLARKIINQMDAKC